MSGPPVDFYVGDSRVVRGLDSHDSSEESNVVGINTLEVFLLEGKGV